MNTKEIVLLFVCRACTYLSEAVHGRRENDDERPRLNTFEVPPGAFVCVVDDAKLTGEPV